MMELLRLGLCFGVALILLVVIVVVLVVVLWSRRGPEGGVEPLEPPPYPSDPGWTGEPEPEVDRVPRGDPAGVEDVKLETEGPEDPPPTTVIDEEWDVGNRVGVRYEGRPSEPPGFPAPGSHPAPADPTRISEEGPEMSTVAMLADHDDRDMRLDVDRPVVTIGRSGQSDIRIDHETVSDQHAVIEFDEGEFRVYDLGSTEGTFVDDVQVTVSTVLEDGMVVRFGEKAFVFHVRAREV